MEKYLVRGVRWSSNYPLNPVLEIAPAGKQAIWAVLSVEDGAEVFINGLVAVFLVYNDAVHFADMKNGTK